VSAQAQPLLAPRIEEELRADSLRLLEQEHAYLDAHRPIPEVELLSLCGNEAEQLSKVANDAEVDLVVIGSHGRGALGRLLLGSVASSLARICPRPLLVVPPQH
jgi:nucleotide-binding universal stress UspA family protein